MEGSQDSLGDDEFDHAQKKFSADRFFELYEEYNKIYQEKRRRALKIKKKMKSRRMSAMGAHPGTVVPSSAPAGLCAKIIVVDARRHMLGRLASILAKELLNGQNVVVVRCEEICLSGGLVRQKVKYLKYLRKTMRTNPSKGPIHFRSPARFFLKTIRGMVPHKTKRGADALERLMAFEGIPAPYDKMKRMVVPDALQVLRLQPGRKFCVLGDLCEEAGWRYYDTIKVLEEKRKAQSKVFYERKKQLMQLRLQVSKRIEVRINACWRRGRQFGRRVSRAGNG